MSKGDSGSRRWIERRAIDTRPIVSEFDVPRWQRALEAVAPWGCAGVAAATAAIAAYAWATDLFAGHLK